MKQKIGLFLCLALLLTRCSYQQRPSASVQPTSVKYVIRFKCLCRSRHPKKILPKPGNLKLKTPPDLRQIYGFCPEITLILGCAQADLVRDKSPWRNRQFFLITTSRNLRAVRDLSEACHGQARQFSEHKQDADLATRTKNPMTIKTIAFVFADHIGCFEIISGTRELFSPAPDGKKRTVGVFGTWILYFSEKILLWLGTIIMHLHPTVFLIMIILLLVLYVMRIVF